MFTLEEDDSTPPIPLTSISSPFSLQDNERGTESFLKGRYKTFKYNTSLVDKDNSNLLRELGIPVLEWDEETIIDEETVVLSGKIDSTAINLSTYRFTDKGEVEDYYGDIDLVREIIKLLSTIHGHGYVHRNFNVQSILVTPGSKPIIRLIHNERLQPSIDPQLRDKDISDFIISLMSLIDNPLDKDFYQDQIKKTYQIN